MGSGIWCRTVVWVLWCVLRGKKRSRGVEYSPGSRFVQGE